MSEDESVVLIASAFVSFIAWMRWYLEVLWVQRMAANFVGRAIVLVAPVIALGLLFASLRTVAAHDVRDDSQYVLFYFALGAAWLGVGLQQVMPLLGLSARDDVLERFNPAAAYAVGGAILGLMLAFIGGNIGDGPGWWVVMFSSGLATLSLCLIWLILERYARVSDSVTIERDSAAGIRLGAFLLACGAIFGRAAAGNWESAAATLVDFASFGAPALILLPFALAWEKMARPRPERPVAPVFLHGIVPAALYLGIAACSILLSGSPA